MFKYNSKLTNKVRFFLLKNSWWNKISGNELQQAKLVKVLWY